MYKPQRDTHSHAKFGGKAPWKQGPRGQSFDQPSFPATCADCGASCTVPFRPNGRKPVLCRSCFTGGNAGNGGDLSFDRPKFDRPKFGGSSSRERSFSSPSRGGNVEKQLEEMNVKLDAILRALKSLDRE